MSGFDNDSYDTVNSMATLVRASCTSRSIMIQPPLNYATVKRLIEVDDESISPITKTATMFWEKRFAPPQRSWHSKRRRAAYSLS